ncbi:response regulator transcription factor [Cupriavidus agavae]|uniref:LuxR family two component transcriptional regulator n=1 Tax=Cupriavidus agavae TaxID=1001822 RepID=A0A4Q7S7J1_9BURK|nr:response regulator transcription factor [Cupriavidus agavae]RZT42335.1 LuxR family two component transcriptional regulator [Cupriavidus agavae]
MTRIILADDHTLIITGLRALLGGKTNCEIVGEAANPEALLTVLQEHPCDVLVTDFHMPDERCADGLVMLGMIRRRFPQVRVIVLTALANPGLVGSMLQEGVRGILGKGGNMSELPLAIKEVMNERIYLCKSIRRELERFDRNVFAQQPTRVLSPSELEVVRLYASGLSVTSIAGVLHRSIKTISTHKRNAMIKLGLDSDAALCQYASRNGLN